MEFRAKTNFVRVSPQKARLVVNLIRGMKADTARTTLRTTNKRIAPSVEKVLRSAIANAENREDHVDVDRLFVKEVFVDGGPMMKRVRPAPMGRAFRVLKRYSHITIKLDTRKGAGKGK